MLRSDLVFLVCVCMIRGLIRLSLFLSRSHGVCVEIKMLFAIHQYSMVLCAIFGFGPVNQLNTIPFATANVRMAQYQQLANSLRKRKRKYRLILLDHQFITECRKYQKKKNKHFNLFNNNAGCST